MSDEHDEYLKIGRYGVYYVDVQKRNNQGEIRRCVGIGNKRFHDVVLEPIEALALLTWLSDHKDEISSMARDMDKKG